MTDAEKRAYLAKIKYPIPPKPVKDTQVPDFLKKAFGFK